MLFCSLAIHFGSDPDPHSLPRPCLLLSLPTLLSLLEDDILLCLFHHCVLHIVNFVMSCVPLLYPHYSPDPPRLRCDYYCRLGTAIENRPPELTNYTDPLASHFLIWHNVSVFLGLALDQAFSSLLKKWHPFHELIWTWTTHLQTWATARTLPCADNSPSLSGRSLLPLKSLNHRNHPAN